MCCILWRFAWIRNRQYRQLRRLCCEILVHSCFTRPEPLLSASYCIRFCCSAVTTVCSTDAVPSGRCSTSWRKRLFRLMGPVTEDLPSTEYRWDTTVLYNINYSFHTRPGECSPAALFVFFLKKYGFWVGGCSVPTPSLRPFLSRDFLSKFLVLLVAQFLVFPYSPNSLMRTLSHKFRGPEF